MTAILSQRVLCYRFEGVSSLWREIFPFGSTKSSTWGNKTLFRTEQQVAAEDLRLNWLSLQQAETAKPTLANAWQNGKSVYRCSPDLNHGFGQQLCPEQLQHGLHDVLPALSQDVAVPMGQVKHSFGCRLSLAVAAKHCREVFHRLQGDGAKTQSETRLSVWSSHHIRFILNSK